jgi:hypothetical protein
VRENKKTWKPIIVRVSPNLHRKAKALLCLQGMSMQFFLEKMLADYVTDHEESSIDNRLQSMIKGAGNGVA